MSCKPKSLTPAQHAKAMRAHLRLEAGFGNGPQAMVGFMDVDTDALLLALDAEEGSHYVKFLESLNLPIDLDETLRTAQDRGLATLSGRGKDQVIELTQEGRKVLAQLMATPKKISRKTSNTNTPNQEDAVAKTEKIKSKKPKAEKTKGERTPNEGSHRWVAIKAMEENPNATREQITAICMKANGGDAEVWAKRIARARRFAKKTGRELGALAKPVKADKPAKAAKVKAKPAKADKPKAKVKKAKAAESEMLG